MAVRSMGNHQQVLADAMSNLKEWEAFLRFWSRQYKYSFSNVLEIYEKDQTGTAFATIKQWNNLGRLVNAGTKGIPIVKYGQRHHVFDIRDTFGKEIAIWHFDHVLENAAADQLVQSMGITMPSAETGTDRIHMAISTYVMERLPNITGKEFAPHTIDEIRFMKNTAIELVMQRCGYPLNLYGNLDSIPNFGQKNPVGMMDLVHEVAGSAITALVKASKEAEKSPVLIHQDNHEEIVSKQERPLEPPVSEEEENELVTPQFDVEPEQKNPHARQTEPLTLMDFLDPSEAASLEDPAVARRKLILDKVVSQGSAIAESKERIHQYFNEDHKREEYIAFLKKEYGHSGRTMDLPDGSRGHWSSWPNKGIEVSVFGSRDTLLLTWPMIHDAIQEKIHAGRYLEANKPKRKPTVSAETTALETEDRSQKDEESSSYDPVERVPEEDGKLPAEKEKVKALNYHMPDDFDQGGGQKTKYRQNAAAIRLLKQFESEERIATQEDQVLLAKYAGWGGLPQAFDPDKADWTDEFHELKNELLTPEEYVSARESTLNAHYSQGSH